MNEMISVIQDYLLADSGNRPARHAPLAALESLEEQLKVAERERAELADYWKDRYAVVEERERDLEEQLEAARKALRLTGERVHLVLYDHFSGMTKERLAAEPAYSWLTVVFEYEDDRYDLQLRDVDGIVKAALDPVAAGLHPKALAASSPASVFPAGGSSVGEKNLRVGQPGHSRIMDTALRDAPGPADDPFDRGGQVTHTHNPAEMLDRRGGETSEDGEAASRERPSREASSPTSQPEVSERDVSRPDDASRGSMTSRSDTSDPASGLDGAEHTGSGESRTPLREDSNQESKP